MDEATVDEVVEKPLRRGRREAGRPAMLIDLLFQDATVGRPPEDLRWRRDYDGIAALRTTLECSYWETFPKGKIPDAAWAALRAPRSAPRATRAASPSR